MNNYDTTKWLKEQQKKEKAKTGLLVAWGVFIVTYVIIGIMFLKLL